MDHQTNIQKRKRADIIQDALIIAGAADDEETIIVDTRRHGLPSIIEDDPDDSDVDQPDNEPLEKSTLFWSTQLVISLGEDDEIGLEKPSTKHQMKGVPNLLRKIFII
jgi:hypothetical protein